MGKKHKYSLLLILPWLSLAAYAQTDSAFLTRAVTKLEKQPVREKVYLHLEKPNYAFGDTIWYKAYTVIGAQHQLSGAGCFIPN